MRLRPSPLGFLATHLLLASCVRAIPIFDAIPGIFSLAEDAFSGDTVLDSGAGSGSGNGEGWLARWLAFGGEGEVTIQLPNTTLDLPHRPASFPSYLPHYLTLPISGYLVSIESLANTSTSTSSTASPPSAESISSPAIGSPAQACSAPPLSRWYPPRRPYTIALVERGACDFASKVLYAQSLGAAGVIVGDTKAYPGETDEEGRERRGLLTMFSPTGETEDVRVPSVFVSRSGYLLLRDLLADGVVSGPKPAMADVGGATVEGLRDGTVGASAPDGRSNATAPWIELGEAQNEGGTIGNLLSFSLLMPSCFLIITIVANRARVARRMDRAPPEVVLALPERVWQPDIAWEKSSCSSASGSGSVRGNGAHGIDGGAGPSRASGSAGRSGTSSSSTSPSPHSRSTGAGGAEALKVDTQMAATLPNTVPLKTSAQSQALQFSNTTSASAAGGGGGSKRSRSRSSTATAMSSTSAQSMHTARTSQSISNSDRVTGMSSGSGGVAAPLPARDLYSTASAPISPVDGFNSNTSTPTATTFGRTGPLAAAEGSRRYSVTRNGRVRDISAPPPSASNSVASEYHSFPSREPSLDPAFRRTAPQSPSTIRTVQQQHRQPTQPSRSHETAHTHAHTHKKYYAQDECAICMDDFQPGQIVRILPCGHVFHKDECDEWLMKWRKLCPTCRADVTVPARAMAGSTITPVILRDPSGAEVLTAEPAVLGADDGDRPNILVHAARGVRDTGAAGWAWLSGGLRGWVRRRDDGRAGERERLVPGPNGDEI